MGRVVLRLLGLPEVRIDGRPFALERRTAVLVAYLALEGPTPRLRISSRLWPDVSERMAQANLRQLLLRLRRSTGLDLVQGRSLLVLHPDMDCDVIARARHLAEGRLDDAVALDGTLLDGCDLDGTLEMEAWLRHRRELASLELGRAYAALLERAESEMDSDRARRLAERWLARDPGSRLARRFATSTAVRVRSPELPLEVLRPPLRVGREREWEQMERAFDRGALVLVVGEPGVGKSRLLLDFAAAHGNYDVVLCRPGDADVPYATFARHFRRRAERFDDLPAWAQRETLRVVPGLSDAPPASDRVGTPRLREALLLAFATCTRGFDALVTDDMQLMDRGTFEIGQAVLAELEAGRTDLPRFLDACRTDELPAETDAAITRLEHLGLATRIELRPLRPEDARAMLRSMDIPGLAPLVDELVEYVGGHPLFLVETLRHLIETDSLRPGFSARLPGGRRVRGLVEARLARLSEPARALARVAAVLREDFTPERAAAVLGWDLMALCEPLVELSSAHIHDGHRFHFDLVGEVVLASVVPAMASAIRRKAAEVPFRTADSRA